MLGCYLPVALYLKAAHFDDRPAGLRPLLMYRTGAPCIYAATMWVSDSVRHVEIYEGNTRIGTSSAMINHPERPYTFDGKRWKVLHFKLDRDPVGNGRAHYGLPIQ